MLVLLTKENIMSGINKKLEKLYNSYYDKAKQAYKEQKPKIERQGAEMSSPLLIKIDEKAYKKADKKIMIFGQETYGWHGEFGDKDIKFLQKDYLKYLTGNKEDFSGNEEQPYISSKIRLTRRNKSSFWKAVKWFKREIDDDSYFVWNNVSKIGKKGRKTGMNCTIRCFESHYFSVIESEVKILKPDIIIFLTGDRDEDIKRSFNVEFVKQSILAKKKYKFAKVKIKDLNWNCKAVRLNHPSYFGGYNATRKQALSIIS